MARLKIVLLLLALLAVASPALAQEPPLPPIATLPPPLSAQGAAGWRWAAVGQLTRFPAHTEYTEIIATFRIETLGPMGYAEFIEAHLEPVVKKRDGVINLADEIMWADGVGE